MGLRFLSRIHIHMLTHKSIAHKNNVPVLIARKTESPLPKSVEFRGGVGDTIDLKLL